MVGHRRPFSPPRAAPKLAVLMRARGADTLHTRRLRRALCPRSRMHDPQNPEILFLEHLGWINRVAEKTCAHHGVWGPEAQDFAASIRLRLMEDDYAIIRNHRGDSSLKTYL